MSDPCSFSAPSECECTHINWFVNVLFEKHILDCRAELEFEVKKNNVEKLVSMALAFDCDRAVDHQVFLSPEEKNNNYA